MSDKLLKPRDGESAGRESAGRWSSSLSRPSPPLASGRELQRDGRLRLTARGHQDKRQSCRARHAVPRFAIETLGAGQIAFQNAIAFSRRVAVSRSQFRRRRSLSGLDHACSLSRRLDFRLAHGHLPLVHWPLQHMLTPAVHAEPVGRQHCPIAPGLIRHCDPAQQSASTWQLAYGTGIAQQRPPWHPHPAAPVQQSLSAEHAPPAPRQQTLCG